MSGEWFLGKEGGRASHDAHISKSRYGAPGTRHPAQRWVACLFCVHRRLPMVVVDESRRGNV
jgi:hypothetical protein